MAEATNKKTWLERHLGLAVAGVGILSGLLSAYATHSWTRSRELGKSHLELRVKAYSSFIEAQTQLWQARGRREEKLEGDANKAIGEAKLNIFLTGSPGVICAMASYWAREQAVAEEKLHPCADAEEASQDVAIYQEMRREVFSALGADDPGLSAAVMVPYLRGCLLPGTDRTRLCASP